MDSGRVVPINDENVILCVHAYTADLSDLPIFQAAALASWDRQRIS